MCNKVAQEEQEQIRRSCGCVFCDLGLEPEWRYDPASGHAIDKIWFHATKHGDVPCERKHDSD